MPKIKINTGTPSSPNWVIIDPNLSTGVNSHAEGTNTIAAGDSSHAEGLNTKVIGSNTTIQGGTVTSCGESKGVIAVYTSDSAMCQSGDIIRLNYFNGSIHKTADYLIDFCDETVITITNYTIPSDFVSFDTDYNFTVVTPLDGVAGHAEGENTVAREAAHAEGTDTRAYGKKSHAEGFGTKTIGEASHAEGENTVAIGYASHVEGTGSLSRGMNGHAEGYFTSVWGDNGHAEGENTTANDACHAEGFSTQASGYASHTEGYYTQTNASYAHAEGDSTSANGNASHAEGRETTATGQVSHVEGYQSIADGDYSHAQGRNTRAKTEASHTEGQYTKVNVTSSSSSPIYKNTDIATGSQQMRSGHAEGFDTLVTGAAGHAEGISTNVSGVAGHAEGLRSVAGAYSHSEGYGAKATSVESVTLTPTNNVFELGSSSVGLMGAGHAEGFDTVSSGSAAHAEGVSTIASGPGSHAEGMYTMATSRAAHAEGMYTMSGWWQNAYEIVSFSGSTLTLTPSVANINVGSVVGIKVNNSKTLMDLVVGVNSGAKTITLDALIPDSNWTHVLALKNTGSDFPTHTEGLNTLATANGSHAEGIGCTATANSSHAEGNLTKAPGSYAHSQGQSTIASGVASHAAGVGTIADSSYGYAGGYYTSAGGYSNVFIIGKYGVGNASDAFFLANGTSAAAQGLAFKILNNGYVYGDGPYTGTGADYSELFEWLDGNLSNEDRVGFFVALDGDKIRKATSSDDYILGVVSSNPSVVGDGAGLRWYNKYVTDDWGRIQYQFVDIAPTYGEDYVINENGDAVLMEVELTPARKDWQPILNPEWNNDEPYVERAQRPEWSPIGMMGKLFVWDDGTCEVNGFCKPNNDGIATKSTTPRDGVSYRVMKRVTSNIIQIVMK